MATHVTPLCPIVNNEQELRGRLTKNKKKKLGKIAFIRRTCCYFFLIWMYIDWVFVRKREKKIIIIIIVKRMLVVPP